ncbi:MAG: histidine kinase, partial [Psychrosphaera sp.]|nr:histidine kinase [Psychrosphaera sp.]
PLIYWIMPWITWDKERSKQRNLAAVLLVGPLIAMIHSHIDYWTFMAIYQQISGMDLGGVMEHIVRSIYAGAVGSIIELWALIGAFSALDYYRRLQQHEMRLLSAEKDLADARLTSLRMQLNPHFLFNAFNSVISLIDSNKENAKDMLSELSSLMRHLLKQDKRHTVTLQQEIEFNQKYLDIESIRFQDRLSIHIDIAVQAQQALVPNLILQPMIENALKHGFAQTVGDCSVTISADIEGERLHLAVSDNGKGCEEKDVLNDPGIGLSNIQKRLEQMFGDDFSINIQRVLPSGFQISLEMPYIYSTIKKRK